jgi:tetratricopeptide (TPR) repeat protein
LERLGREWSASARPDECDALAKVLQELEDTRLLEGRARARCLLAIAWPRCTRGEVSQLDEIAAEALRLAQESGDRSAEADARCLAGDALQAHGKLAEAQAVYDEHLAIFQRLTDEDPSNAGWQRALAVAHSRVGDVLQAQGKLPEAQAAFERDLVISKRLAEQDPNNAGWQWELAVAHNRVGDVLQAQGKLAEAQPLFEKYLSTSRRLAAEYPSNVGYRHDLIVAQSRMGEILQAQEKLAAALLAVAAALENSRQLVEQDASNTAWQRDLARIHSQASGLFLICGFVEDAKEYQSRAVQIRQLVALREPGNARFQRDVLSALSSFFSSDEHYGRFALRDLADSQMQSVVHNLDQLRSPNAAPPVSANERPKPATLFICYSSVDNEWRVLLQPTLDLLKRDGFINFWYDRMVDAGKNWDEEIQKQLDGSEIVLCLVSREFLAAPYIQEIELPKALDRHEAGKARLIPLIVRSCNWAHSPLYALQTATGDKRPLKGREDLDEAYVRIELELQNIWRELRGLPKERVQ